jgi:hypothetical protein
MKFALITEGVSEQKIIKHILNKYFKDKEPIINPIQPKLLNDKQETIGGWNEVLKYCEREGELKAILIENEYLVIQIDSDQCQQTPFDISHSKQDNTTKSVEELHRGIVEKLRGLIKPEIMETYSGRILFAISIHTIECWLLPLYYTNNHKSNTTSCMEKLNTEITKRNINGISSAGKNSPQAIKSYDSILKNWKKKEEIVDSSAHNAGFSKFVESMESLKDKI